MDKARQRPPLSLNPSPAISNNKDKDKDEHQVFNRSVSFSNDTLPSRHPPDREAAVAEKEGACLHDHSLTSRSFALMDDDPENHLQLFSDDCGDGGVLTMSHEAQVIEVLGERAAAKSRGADYVEVREGFTLDIAEEIEVRDDSETESVYSSYSAYMEQLQNEDWMDGVDIHLEPKFTDFDGMCSYIHDELLNDREKTLYKQVLLFDESLGPHSAFVRKSPTHLKVYCYYLLAHISRQKKSKAFAYVAGDLNAILEIKNTRDKYTAKAVRLILLPDNTVTYVSLSTFIKRNIFQELALLAKKEEPEGEARNARYWLVRSYDKFKSSVACTEMNKHYKDVPTPFGNKWEFTHIEYMRGELHDEMTDKLLADVPRNSKHNLKAPYKRIFFLVNRGNKNLLRSFIRLRRNEHSVSFESLADKLTSAVEVPGHKGNFKWKASMVRQVYEGKQVIL